MATVPALSSEEKAVIAAFAALLAAHKAEYEAAFQPFLSKLEGEAVAFASDEAAKISNPFLRYPAEWVVSTFGPELPALVAQYEGSVYDKFVAFLVAISK